MLVLSRKKLESIVVGGTIGFERLAQGYGTRTQEWQRTTRLRGRFVRSNPPFGDMGEDPSRRANQ